MNHNVNNCSSYKILYKTSIFICVPNFMSIGWHLASYYITMYISWCIVYSDITLDQKPKFQPKESAGDQGRGKCIQDPNQLLSCNILDINHKPWLRESVNSEMIHSPRIQEGKWVISTKSKNHASGDNTYDSLSKNFSLDQKQKVKLEELIKWWSNWL